MTEVWVTIEVGLTHRGGPFVSKEQLAEAVVDEVTGEVEVDDSVYEITGCYDGTADAEDNRMYAKAFKKEHAS